MRFRAGLKSYLLRENPMQKHRFSPLKWFVLFILLLAFIATYFSYARFSENQQISARISQNQTFFPLFANSLEASALLTVESHFVELFVHNTQLSPALLTYWHEYQQLTDQNVQQTLANMPLEMREKHAELNVRWRKALENRQTVETALQAASKEHNEALMFEWKKNNRALIAEFLGIAPEINSLQKGNESQALSDLVNARFENMALLLYELQTALNEEANALMQSLALQKSTVLEATNHLLRYRANATRTWALFKREAAYLTDDFPEFAAALANVEQQLFEHFFILNDDVLRVYLQRETSQISLEQYAKAYLTATENMHHLMQSLINTAHSLNKAQLNAANNAQFTGLAGFALSLLLGSTILLLILKRIITPLKIMTEQVCELCDQLGEPRPKEHKGNAFLQAENALMQLNTDIAHHLWIEQNQRKIAAVWQQIASHAHSMIIATDQNGLINLFNQSAVRQLGFSAEEVIGKTDPVSLIFDPAEIMPRAARLSAVLGTEVASNFDFFARMVKAQHSTRIDQEWQFICKDGKRLDVWLTLAPLYESAESKDEISGFLMIAQDRTERKRLEAKLREAALELEKKNTVLEVLLQSAPVGIFMVEAPSRQPLLANALALEMLGIKKDDMTPSFMAYKLPERVAYPHDELPLTLAMQGISSRIDNMLIIAGNGQERVLEVSGAPVKDKNGVVWASMASLLDVSDRSEASAEMSRMAYLDFLTQLPNRRLFNDRLAVYLTQARRTKQRLALMSIDLDKFKPVNDNLGHAVGDILLQQVAVRMRECLRESDTLARVGGDEFAAILPNILKTEDALHVGEKIRLALNEPFLLDDRYTVNIACCIGVAYFPDHTEEEKQLLEFADEALYTAKRGGRNCVIVYSTPKEALPHEKTQPTQVWDTNNECGNPFIDQAHRRLFSRINTIIARLNEPQLNRPLLLPEIDELIRESVNHFTEEEAILKKMGSEEVNTMQLQHQKILGELKEGEQQINAANLTGAEFMQSVMTHFMEHLIHVDKIAFDALAMKVKKK